MNLKKISDRVLFALSVPECVCCGKKLDYENKALCPKCSEIYLDHKLRNCSKCSKILMECDCSNEFLSSHFVKRVVKCFRYMKQPSAEPSNRLIYSLKRDNRADVLDFCSDELTLALRNSVDLSEDVIITNVPRRKGAIIEFGIDHSALLARKVAEKTGTKYMPLLESNTKKAQKSLDSIDRMKNAKFEIKKEADLSGKTVIIIDDIITSGASMAMAASLIRSMGSHNIIAGALGIVYKED